MCPLLALPGKCHKTVVRAVFFISVIVISTIYLNDCLFSLLPNSY